MRLWTAEPHSTNGRMRHCGSEHVSAQTRAWLCAADRNATLHRIDERFADAMETNLLLFPSRDSISPTVTAAERLASEIADAIDAIAARIPRFEAPHPSTAAGVRGARTVSRDFLLSMIAAVDGRPELQSIAALDAEEARAALQSSMPSARSPTAWLALLASATYTMASRKGKIAAAALTTYAIAKAVARDPNGAPSSPTSRSSAATSGGRIAPGPSGSPNCEC